MGMARDDYLMLLGRQGKTAKKNNNPEYQLQCWMALWLSSLNVLYCANAGAGLKLSIGQAVKTKRMGYRAGFPDMGIFEIRGKYHAMFIELKVKSYPSDLQKAWQEALTARGYYAVIVPANLDYMGAREWVEREVKEYLALA